MCPGCSREEIAQRLERRQRLLLIESPKEILGERLEEALARVYREAWWPNLIPVHHLHGGLGGVLTLLRK